MLVEHLKNQEGIEEDEILFCLNIRLFCISQKTCIFVL